MSEEKVYIFNEYVLGYDSSRDNDRSCLTISKILNDNMYVMSTLYDESAEVISTMLDYLQQKVEQLEKELQITANKCKQLENIRKEAIEYIEEWQSFPHTNCTTHNELKNLLNILNKGE